MTSYLIILGREGALSLSEFEHVCAARGIAFTRRAVTRTSVVVESAHDLAPLIDVLGGTVKIGMVDAVFPDTPTVEDLAAVLAPHTRSTSGKWSFGISVFPDSSSDRLLKLAQSAPKQLKRLLKETGVNARFVSAQGAVLNAAQVRAYDLTGSGVELLLARTALGVVAAHTVALQPFEEFSRRDYGRPSRDARSGMLPPKLARMMVNLAGDGTGKKLLDPFCGSGTILSEALHLGYTDVAGSDLSPKAVDDARRNIAWAGKNNVQLQVHDATQLDTVHTPHSVDVIVTEPLLGPPLNGNEQPARLTAIVGELRGLYLRFLKSARTIIAPDGILVMVIPSFKTKKGFVSPLSLEDITTCGWQVQDPLDPAALNRLQAQMLPFPALWWRRPQQHLGRAITLLTISR